MVLIFVFFYCHQTIRVAVLLEFETISSCWTWYGNVFSFIVTKLARVAVLLEIETISSCWTWYGTDVFFPFLSPNYQSHRVIRFCNNIKLLELLC